MKKIRVGLIGAGFISDLHMHAYRRVYGLDVEVTSVCSRGDGADAFAKRHGIPKAVHDYRMLLTDPEIDVVDICTPAVTHGTMVEEAVLAGKHAICEKPFTGYFGEPGDKTPVGSVDKRKMYDAVLQRMDRLADVVRKSGRLFLYAEDWVYAPTVTKAASILRATKDKVLFMKAEESHSGSHAWHAAQWDQTGGGALIRQGVHPMGAVIRLKMEECAARGEKFGIEFVTGEVGNVTAGLTDEEKKYIAARPVDVEDWAMATLGFTDGTRATVFAGDFVTGGVRNLVEFNTNTGTLVCNIAPNDTMMTYFAGDEKLKDVYLTEKVETKTGWQFVCVDEEAARGYTFEVQDFMECIATGREPISGLPLAVEATKAVYAAYLSAEIGARVRY